MYQSDASRIMEAKNLPEFMNTPEKWSSLVEYIDTAKKFDDIALQILDDDDIDVFDFRDIIVKLGHDIKCIRPKEGEWIMLLTDTVVEMLDFLTKKSQERFQLLVDKLSEYEIDF